MFNPPWAADITPKPLPAASVESTANMDDRRQSGMFSRNPQTGLYQQLHPARNSAPYQYYQPPPRRDPEDQRRSFSERVDRATESSGEGVTQSDSKSLGEKLQAVRDSVAGGPLNGVLAHGGTTSDDLSQTQHINSVPLPTSLQPDPSQDDEDDVPENLRARPWSPEQIGETQEQHTNLPERQESNASSSIVRRGSVPHRSPLQKLEGHLDNITKEEKRARLEDAENTVRRKSLSGHGKQGIAGEADLSRGGTLRSEKGRVVSDGSRRPTESASDQYYQDRPRHVSTGAPLSNDQGEPKFKRATEALKLSTSPRGLQDRGPMSAPLDRAPERQTSSRQRHDPPIAHEPRPYHHAPAAPRDRGIRQEPRPYHHAPAAPRDLGIAHRPVSMPPENIPTTDSGVQRSPTGNYKRRLRDAGFAGAAVAAGTAAVAVASNESSAADRGRAVHERRKSMEQSNNSPAIVQNSTFDSTKVERSGSRKLQKKAYTTDGTKRESMDQSRLSQASQGIPSDTDQATTLQMHESSDTHLRREHTASSRSAVPYRVPPQTENGQQARLQVGFDPATIAETGAAGAAVVAGAAVAGQQSKRQRFAELLHGKNEPQNYPRGTMPLEEWRNAKAARLSLSDLEFGNEPVQSPPAGTSDAAWWEKNKGTRRSSGSAAKQPSGPSLASAQLDGPYEEEATMFQPQLFLTCGPLLRYTGIRRETSTGRSGATSSAVWRGTVLIVTEDTQSDLRSAPTLRLFAQPMDLLQHPPKQHVQDHHDLPPELEDPIAGQVKVSRTGRPLYVRPVHDIQGGVDLSRQENNSGLYSATRTPLLGPQSSSVGATATGGGQDRTSTHITFQDKIRIKRRDGEKLGKYRDVKAIRLHTERGVTFWRFSIEIELGSIQHRVAYRINNGPALGFWVPGRNESMNMMFHSCNGFSMPINPDAFSGPDPLWRDVLNKHQHRPFHVMVGGGDQLYNDCAARDTQLFGEWIRTKNPDHKHNAPFTPEMQDELEAFYLHRYAMWFSQGLFAMAGSQIPMVNLWDDHDIIDGYGSYPHRLMASKVFTGLGAVAFKYYMLFQHQSVVAETEKEEPSWILGSSRGPYINELSRSIFLDLGPHLKFLGIDCRTERMRDEIVSEETYDILFDRCEREIIKGETKHLIVLLGVPIAYPRLNFLENILTSRIMDPIKAVGRTGMLGGFVNKFDGGVEILDDLDDHWTAKHHKAERNWFIQELQEFAAQKSVRVTILGGDVHLGAVGQFYTPRKLGISKDKDHRYMPNVISSAIVNTPPPTMMADVLNRRNKIHHLDAVTDEDLIPMFDVDVDGSKRNNKCLLPRRNYATIREFLPGNTPPSTPRFDDRPSVPGTPGSYNSIQDEGLWSTRNRTDTDRRFPPGSMRRTMSLTRGPVGSLVRRLSGSSKSRPPPMSSANQTPYGPGSAAPGMGRSNSLSSHLPGQGGSYFPPPPGEQSQRPSFAFHRRPTNFSEKELRRAASKGGAPRENEGEQPPVGHIDLEGGLDISLNMEVNQRDPSGHTRAYRLLVPALFYQGGPDTNTARLKTNRTSFITRLKSVRRRKEIEDHSGEVEGGFPPPSAPPQPYQQFQQQQQPPPPSQTASYRPQVSGPLSAHPVNAEPRYSQRFGNDGYNDHRASTDAVVASSGRQSMDVSHTKGAYDKGYNLSGPPIGAGHYATAPAVTNSIDIDNEAAPPRMTTSDNYPYPSQRRSQAAAPPSAPYTASSAVAAAQQQPNQGLPRASANPHRSLTPSDGAYEDEDDHDSDALEEEFPPQRRQSKAERFFGIGDAPVPGRTGTGGFVEPGPGYQRVGGNEKKGRGWRIWESAK